MFNEPFNIFLTFSDAAKFADIARNLINGLGYGGKFTFWGGGIFEFAKHNLFPSTWTPPLMPFSIAAFFKIFGVSDFSVIATSFFYFILLLAFVFLLGRKIFKSNLIGILSTIAVGFNQSTIAYATSGASEIPFMFEIISSAYFLSLKKKWGSIIGFFLMVMMYFTRPQAFIYIAGLILFYFLLKFDVKRALLYFVGVLILALAADKFILVNLAGKYFFYPILARGSSVINQAVVGSPTSEYLRGISSSFPALQIFKKIFYDLYNFYKLLPDILSPYLWALFIIGLFRWTKDKTYNALKIAAIIMIALTFLVTAITIPFFRYIHPVVPLIYLFAADTLIWIVGKISDNKRFVILTSSFLILFFVVGQTLGVIFLDSRAVGKTVNKGQPPVYVKLSRILRDNTKPVDVVVTNLDTWGSWYGERKTVWYPLKPDMLDPGDGEKIPFDAIYLTSYLIDDENYYMGEEWRQIFENPKSPKDEFIAKNYKFAGEFKVPAEETYEKQEGRAILLVRN
jgi:4-amino-4-deoxy-L-arabinose transferase-like glycosyltransferase